MCIYIETNRPLKGISPVKAKLIRRGNTTKQFFVYAVQEHNYRDIIEQNGDFKCRWGINLEGARV